MCSIGVPGWEMKVFLGFLYAGASPLYDGYFS